MTEAPTLFTDPQKPPRAPVGLGTAGRNLYSGIVSRYEVRYADELPVVVQAAKVADLIVDLEKALEGADLVVLGSMKQQVANPLLGEIRATRAQLAALFRQLNLPNEEGSDQAESSKSPRHQRAAATRWAMRAAAQASERARGEGGGY